MEVNQYDIFWVNLDPSVGSEIRKVRPCVVISPDEMNGHIKTVVVAPLTTATRNYPTRIPVSIGVDLRFRMMNATFLDRLND